MNDFYVKMDTSERTIRAMRRFCLDMINGSGVSEPDLNKVRRWYEDQVVIAHIAENTDTVKNEKLLQEMCRKFNNVGIYTTKEDLPGRINQLLTMWFMLGKFTQEHIELPDITEEL